MASPKGGNLGALIGLILSIFVIIVLVFVCYQLNSQVTEAKSKVTTLQEDIREEDQKQIKVRADLQKLNKVVHGSTNPVDPEILRRDYLDTALGTLKTILEQEQYASEQFSTDLRSQGKIEDKPYEYMTQLFRDYERMLAAVIPELNRLRAARDEADGSYARARETARQERRDLEQQIEQLRQEKGRLENEKIEAAKEWDSEKRRLLNEKDEIQRETEKLREDAFVAEARLQSTISKLEERIRQMHEKEQRSLADTDADGEIVHANHRLGRAWIDIGRKDRLRRGVTFEVFQYIKGGKRKKKGMIEIKTVEDDHAMAAIISEVDAADPIVKGDLIASPFYDKRKEMVFVFVGDALTNERYERSQLERRVTDFGGRVDEAVSIDTDFVVAIRNAEQSPEFAKAVQFGVVIMREADLLEFIGQ